MNGIAHQRDGMANVAGGEFNDYQAKSHCHGGAEQAGHIAADPVRVATHVIVPGTLHLVLAGWLIAMGFGSTLTRILLGAFTVVILIATVVLTNALDNYDVVNERWLLPVSALVVVGFLMWEIAGPKAKPRLTPTLTRLVGLFTILAWVTVAASGRWIGLCCDSG